MVAETQLYGIVMYRHHEAMARCEFIMLTNYCSSYSIPGTVLNIMYILTDLILSPTL